MKYYLIRILWTTCLMSVLLSILLVTIILQTSKTDSDALHFNVTGMIYGICILFNIALAIMSLTVFLNLKRKIRDNVMISMLTFLVIPFITIITVIAFTYGNFGKEFWVALAITSPYFVLMIVQFIKFRAQCK